MAKRAQKVNEADYVVVGSGSAGSAVAGRLAESGASVILLEAGGHDEKYMLKKPGMIGPMHSTPQLIGGVDWGYRTVPQRHALDRQIPQPRGKVVGGSSSINGMLWVRGNRADYDAWEADGATGWGSEVTTRLYKEMEDFEDGADEYRGAGGPIKVTRNKLITEASQQFQQAAAEVLGVARNRDYNGAEQEGVSTFQQNAANGLRYSSSRAYIHLRRPAFLSLQTGVTVTRILLEGGRATGVEVRDADSERRVVRAGREIVVAGGVFGSPQLLMLSGIGPADHLRQLGIGVVADLPVGDNMQDHLFVPTTWLMTNARHRGTPMYFARGLVAETLRRGRSFMANSVFESVAFVRTSLAGDRPDMQIHVLPWAYPSPNQDAPGRHAVDPRPSLTVMPTLVRPRSRGTLRLKSSDPTVAPLIDFNYLAEQADTDVLLEGIEMVRAIMASSQIAGSVSQELHPGPAFDAEALKTEIRNRVTTVYHGVGSCRMGNDERAVVDPELRVRGVDGLRVADASVMPSITTGNTNAPAVMIGERCAELLLS